MLSQVYNDHIQSLRHLDLVDSQCPVEGFVRVGEGISGAFCSGGNGMGDQVWEGVEPALGT